MPWSEWCTTLADCHVERGHHELCSQVFGHRPADDSAAERIVHHRQIQEPSPRRDVADVGNPEAVGSISTETPLDQVRRRPRFGIARRRGDPLPAAHTPKTLRLHQPRHAFRADPNALIAQIRMDVRRAVCTPERAW